ncbi:MAG: tyrosine-type recombinase/integrase [Lutibacter sp.]|nr:tyrosine-type recombinase/integrase [Lutibacter sp.]
MRDDSKKTITLLLKKVVHRKKVRLLLVFRYDDFVISKIKKIEGYAWSQTLRGWYTDYTVENIDFIKQTLKNEVVFKLDNSVYNEGLKNFIEHKERKISEENSEVLKSYSSYLKGKCYSESTVKTYSLFIADFFNYLKDTPLTAVTNRDVEKFIEDIFVPKKYSISTHRQFVSAVKLLKVFYPECKIEELQLKRPNKSRILPTVLSKEEVIDLLRYTKNLKHRAILAMIYSAGLRISELLNLKLAHIDVDRRQILVKDSKGRKDRNVILAESIIPLMNNYLMSYRPDRYFVEGKPFQKYSAESIRAFLHQASKLAKITKNVTPHTLRHSYATHLLENGIDLRYIQELLGHAKPETTMIYTHVTKKDLMKIKSPLDLAIKSMAETDKNNKNIRLSGNY